MYIKPANITFSDSLSLIYIATYLLVLNDTKRRQHTHTHTNPCFSNLCTPFVSIFIHKYAEGPVNAVQAAKGQHEQSAQGLSVKGTVNSGPLYPGRPRYDKSELRGERGAWKSVQDMASDQAG